MGYGVFLDGGSGNLVGTDGDGTADAGERNVISGSDFGVMLSSLHTPQLQNTVAGDFIGTDASGTRALGNYAGVALVGGSNDEIGTTGSGAYDADRRNVISGNYYGVLLGAQTTVTFAISSVHVSGNDIGTDVTGQQPLGNLAYGVAINGADTTQVGGPAGPDDVPAGLRNVIAYNGAAGVVVLSNNGHLATGNALRGNSIHDNAGLGVDLGGDGVTPNHTQPAPSGPNHFQNYPVLTAALAGAATEVGGTLTSQPNVTFTLDFYASPAADPTGYGEGARYLGSASVTTDGSGNASFSTLLAGATVAGEVVSAMATDGLGNTSEFSHVVTAVALQANAGGPYAIQAGQSLTLDASQSQGNPTTYSWDVNGDGNFGDVITSSPTVTVTWAQLQALGIDVGTFSNVRVRISNGGARVDSPATTLTVTSLPPTATLSNDGPITYGSPVTVSFTNPFDPSAADTAAGFHYAYSLDNGGSGLATATYANTTGNLASASYTGLSAGTHTVYGRILDKDDGFTQYSTVVTVNPRAASVTPAAAGKTYGDPDPALSGTLVGFLPADGVTATYSRTAGETVAGSAYTISAVLSPAAVLSNYTITYNTAAFGITPRPVTVAASAQTRTYGTADPVLAYRITSGSLAPGDAFSGSLSRVVGEHVGAYAIGQGSLALSGNYALTFQGSTLTITPAALSVVANHQTKVHGQADPALTYVASGFQFTDTAAMVLTGQLTRAPGETVAGGPYAIGQGTLAADSDYTLNFTGNTLTISPDATTTTVASSLNPSPFGQAVTFTAAVTANAPGSGTPTGTVTFYDGSTALGTGTLSGGVATFTTTATGLAAGNHTITAWYNGDGNFLAATSAGLAQTVLSAQQQSQLLVNQVNNLVNSGALNSGNGNALTGKLDDAIASLAAGDTAAGVKRLNQFIQLVRTRKLTAAQAQALIDAANQAIASAQA
jgi:hypothetical protein